MDQDEGRDQDRVGRDQMELDQDLADQGQVDREVAGQDPVDDRVVLRISESSQCGPSVPLVNHPQDAQTTANEGRSSSSSSFGLPSPYPVHGNSCEHQ